MPLLQKIENNDSRIAMWSITETLPELLSMIDERLLLPSRLSEIKKEEMKRQWLASRMALQSLLVEKNIPYDQLLRTDSGKPVLQGSHLHVSLSHTAGITAAIVSPHAFVGIDLETHFEQTFRLRSKFLTDKELEFCGDDLRTCALLWCAKEALYKAHNGKGLIFKDDMYLLRAESDYLLFYFRPLGKEIRIAIYREDQYVMAVVCDQ